MQHKHMVIEESDERRTWLMSEVQDFLMIARQKGAPRSAVVVITDTFLRVTWNEE